MSPKLIVVTSSSCTQAMAGQLFGIACTELPSRRFNDWLERHGHSPESTEARHALAAREWPAELVVEATAAAELLALLARTWSDARFLFLIEEPTTSLAADLPLPGGSTVAAWSVRQEAAARWIRRHLQRHPSRSLCLVLQELARVPQVLEGLLRDRLGVTLRVNTHPLPYDKPSELNQALAGMLLAPEKQLASSAAELLASCPPLGEAPTDGRPALPDGELVLRELAALTERAAVGPRLRAQIAEFESRIAQLDQLLADSERARTDVVARLTRLSTELELAKGARESQQEALRVAQDRLEREAQGKRELAAMLDAQTADLAEARACARQLAEAQALLETSSPGRQPSLGQSQHEQEQLTRGTEPLKTAASDLSSSSALDALRRDNELLLVHLHEVQEELEHYVLENHSLVQRSGHAAGEPFLFVDECLVERAREVSPHLELELRCRGVRLGDGPPFEQIRLRLVEHNARPGIVFAHDPSVDRQFLSSWVETGREGDAPYMLIVPADTSGRTCLQTLPTSDWDALLALVHHLSGALAEAPATTATRWPGVAGHVARQLAELPPRLRYDRLYIARADNRYTVRFENLMFGERRFDQLQLQWQPSAALPLVVLAPAGAASMPPLDEWPKTDGGARQSSVAVPVGNLGFLNKRRQWARLTATDRGLLLALLDALPAAAQAGRADGMLTEDQAVRLRDGAKRLLRDALAASGQREPLRSRLARRLRARWHGHGASAGQSLAVTP